MSARWRLLVASIGILLLVTALVLAVIPGERAPQAAPVEIGQRGYFVLRAPIGGGEQLTPEAIEWREGKANAIAEDAISGGRAEVSSLVGKFATRALIAGEMLRKADVDEQPRGSVVASLLNPGMRAVTIPVDSGQVTAADLKPNDRIDIVVPANPARNASPTETAPEPSLLTSVRVLAVNGATGVSAKASPESASASTAGARAGSTLTVELAPALAGRLAAAASAGPLAVILRRRVDPVFNRPPGPVTLPARTRSVERRRSVAPPVGSEAPGSARSFGNAPDFGVVIVRGRD